MCIRGLVQTSENRKKKTWGSINQIYANVSHFQRSQVFSSSDSNGHEIFRKRKMVNWSTVMKLNHHMKCLDTDTVGCQLSASKEESQLTHCQVWSCDVTVYQPVFQDTWKMDSLRMTRSSHLRVLAIFTFPGKVLTQWRAVGMVEPRLAVFFH